jgi:hypothetical protein
MRTVTNRSAIILVTSVLALCCCLPGHASARTFGGYDCTDNCVGHAAGYRWAEERGIENIDERPANSSDAFYEGCLTYVAPSAAPILTMTAYRSWSRSGHQTEPPSAMHLSKQSSLAGGSGDRHPCLEWSVLQQKILLRRLAASSVVWSSVCGLPLGDGGLNIMRHDIWNAITKRQPCFGWHHPC